MLWIYFYFPPFRFDVLNIVFWNEIEHGIRIIIIKYYIVGWGEWKMYILDLIVTISWCTKVGQYIPQITIQRLYPWPPQLPAFIPTCPRLHVSILQPLSFDDRSHIPAKEFMACLSSSIWMSLQHHFRELATFYFMSVN